jgi:hypothetical protein
MNFIIVGFLHTPARQKGGLPSRKLIAAGAPEMFGIPRDLCAAPQPGRGGVSPPGA